VKLLDSADVFLLPMKDIKAADEGLPTKIFEYQALGKPIICCSRGESAKYVKETDSGLIINPEDAKALADAILYLYNDSELSMKLGANGKKYVNKHLTIEKIGERMYDSMFSVICAHKKYN